MKKTNKNQTNTAANQDTSQFWAIFNYKYKFITADNPYFDPRTGGLRTDRNGKLKPDWRRETSKRPIRQKVLESIYNDPSELIGLSFDTETRYIGFDIDTLSRYHFATDLAALRELLGTLEDLGLVEPVFVLSGYSGGLHVYYFFKEGINSFNLACAAKEYLIEQGVTVQSGTLEIFPNPKKFKEDVNKSYFNGLKLPLQAGTGSCILNDDFEPTGDDIATFERMAQFSADRQDLDTLKIASKKYGNLVRLRRCGKNSNSLEKLLKDLRRAIACAFTAKGQTNDLLLDIGAYGVIAERLDETVGVEALAEYIKETITKLDGYSEYCGHQHEIDKRCLEVAKSCQEYYWAAGKERKRDRKPFKDNFNNVLANVWDGREAAKIKATQKIEAAIAHIMVEARQGLSPIPKNLTAYKQQIIEASKRLFGEGVGKSTLDKDYNKPLWHKAFKVLIAIQVAVSQPVEAAPTTLQAEITAPIAIEQPAEPAIAPVEKRPLKLSEKPVLKVRKNIPSKSAQTRIDTEKTTIEPKKTKPEPPEPAEIKARPPFPPICRLCTLQSDLSEFSNSSNIKKSYVLDPAATPESSDKQNLSEELPKQSPEPLLKPLTAVEQPPKSQPTPQQQAYYKQVLAANPDLNAVEGQRNDPEYQTKARQSFAAIRAILGRSRAKFKHKSPPDYFNRSSSANHQTDERSDEEQAHVHPKPT